MRFPSSFVRYKGAVPAGQFALGSDGAAAVPPTGAPSNQTNLLSSKFYSDQGWPAHRIAVGYKGPAAAIALAAQVWIYDTKTEAWYEVGAAQNITPNRMTYFDVVALLDGLRQDEPTQGSIAALLVVQDGATPDGAYTFSMGADLTTLPL